MSETTACVITFLVATALIGYLIYLSFSAESGKLGTVREGIAEFRACNTYVERFIVFFWYSVAVLTLGFRGFAVAVAGIIASMTSAVCGFTPWPYIVQILDRVMDGFFGSPRIAKSISATGN